jgi:nucleoside-diphosphate-sugar epimerase
MLARRERYLVSQAHKQAGELDRTVQALREATELGIRAFSFSDQAIHPNTMSALANRLISERLDASWCARMLFDPRRITKELVDLMRRAGCRELLFGLESLRPETLKDMGKVGGWSIEHSRRLLQGLEEAKIDVVINIIFAFPTEPDDEFEQHTLRGLIDLLRGLENVSVIANQFELFRDSPIARQPRIFGINSVVAPAGPLATTLEYTDMFGRRGGQPHPHRRNYRQLLEPMPSPKLERDEAKVLTHIDHSTLGLIFRWRTGRYFRHSVRDEGTGGNVFARNSGGSRNVLLLGANAYLGQNLAQAMDPQRLVLSSRSPRNSVVAAVPVPFIRADLAYGPAPLGDIAPREVYVVARPRGSFLMQARFAAHLKSYLYEWAARGVLKRIVLASTQLVYATPPTGRVTTANAPDPVKPYEYFTLELEEFASYLVKHFGLDAEIWRLPLLFGGVILPTQRSQQLIYQWIDALRRGHHWEFVNERDCTYGNSWVWVPDLVGALINRGPGGFQVRQPSSGDFRYAELQASVGGEMLGESMDLIRSQFYLADEEGMTPRALTEMIKEAEAFPKPDFGAVPANPYSRLRVSQ